MGLAEELHEEEVHAHNSIELQGPHQVTWSSRRRPLPSFTYWASVVGLGPVNDVGSDTRVLQCTKEDVLGGMAKVAMYSMDLSPQLWSQGKLILIGMAVKVPSSCSISRFSLPVHQGLVQLFGATRAWSAGSWSYSPNFP